MQRGLRVDRRNEGPGLPTAPRGLAHKNSIAHHWFSADTVDKTIIHLIAELVKAAGKCAERGMTSSRGQATQLLDVY